MSHHEPTLPHFLEHAITILTRLRDHDGMRLGYSDQPEYLGNLAVLADTAAVALDPLMHEIARLAGLIESGKRDTYSSLVRPQIEDNLTTDIRHRAQRVAEDKAEAEAEERYQARMRRLY